MLKFSHMEIQIIKKKIEHQILDQAAGQWYGDMVKAVVDIKKKIIALGGEFHADGQEILIKQGSRAQDLWGINIYLDKPSKSRIEFTALVNIKPAFNHRSMRIQDSKIREKIREIIDCLVP